MEPKSFLLELDELACVLNFLNAKSIPGLDAKALPQLDETQVQLVAAKLVKKGWLVAADRPGTWHINEDLMQTLSIAVSPDYAVLARKADPPQSVLFFVVKSDCAEIVITNNLSVVAYLDGVSALSKHAAEFLSDGRPCELICAAVVDGKLSSVGSAKGQSGRWLAFKKFNVQGLKSGDAMDVSSIERLLKSAMIARKVT